MSSVKEDETLLEEVGRHPILWMLSHPSYKDQKVKANIWYEIAFKVGKPVSHCKKRWRNIKDTFDRKKNKTSLPATPTKRGKKWALEEKLAFLKTAEEHRMSFSNLSTSQCVLPDKEGSLTQPSETVTEPVGIPTTSIPISSNILPGYKRSIARKKSVRKKIADLLEKTEKEKFRSLLEAEKEDDIDLFFKSLAKTVKKFPKTLLQRAKLETLEVISRLESESWESLHSSFYSSDTRTFCSNTSVDVSPDLLYENSD